MSFFVVGGRHRGAYVLVGGRVFGNAAGDARFALRNLVIEPRCLEDVGDGDSYGVRVVDSRCGFSVSGYVLAVSYGQGNAEAALVLKVEGLFHLQLTMGIHLEQRCIRSTH